MAGDETVGKATPPEGAPPFADEQEKLLAQMATQGMCVFGTPFRLRDNLLVLPPPGTTGRAFSGLRLSHNSLLRSCFWMGKPCATRTGRFAAQFLLDGPSNSRSGGEDDC